MLILYKNYIVLIYFDNFFIIIEIKNLNYHAYLLFFFSCDFFIYKPFICALKNIFYFYIVNDDLSEVYYIKKKKKLIK